MKETLELIFNRWLLLERRWNGGHDERWWYIEHHTERFRTLYQIGFNAEGQKVQNPA